MVYLGRIVVVMEVDDKILNFNEYILAADQIDTQNSYVTYFSARTN